MQSAQHVWLHIDLIHALKREPLSSVFSTDGHLISVSAAPYCEVKSQVKILFTVKVAQYFIV